MALRDHGKVAGSRRAEHAAVALDFRGRAEGFRIIVGKLYRRAALNAGNFADQADGVKPVIAAGIAAPKIVGQQRSPTGTEADATARSPFLSIVEIGRAAEIPDGSPAGESSTKISVQAEDVVDVECIGGDDKFVVRIAAAGLQPFDIFIPGYIRILAVNALARPIGGPVRRTFEELRGSERIRQHDPERAFVSALPHLEHVILRS